MLASADVASIYVGLLGDASVRPCVTGRADGVKRMPGANVQSREIEQAATVWTEVSASLWLR